VSDRAKRESSTWRDQISIKHIKFSVHWSEEDEEYVGTCDEYKSLSHLATNPSGALYGIMDLALDVVTEMAT
jgi:hypothetical protein